MNEHIIRRQLESEAMKLGFGCDAGRRARFEGHGPDLVRADDSGNLFVGLSWDGSPHPDAEREFKVRLAACTDALFHAVLDLEKPLTMTIVAVTANPYAARAMGEIVMELLGSREGWFERGPCQVEENAKGLSKVVSRVSLSPESLECV